MQLKRIANKITSNDYVYTIFTKIMAVVIGLIASSYSNRFLGPELKGELGQISSMISIVAVTANFGLYQPYPYYKRQNEPDVLDKFLRIFLLQFIAYTVIGVFAAAALNSFARRFIISAKPDTLPPTCSAMATAASFPLRSIKP